MDFADDYPAAHVIGIDLSPTQPTAVPPNLEFQIMDADEDWDFHARFDLVHSRLMNGFSVRSWPHFYRQAFACMKPGGWVENQEFDLAFVSDDGTMAADGAVNRWQALWNEGVARFGLTGRCFPLQMKDDMEAAGFVNVAIQALKVPVGAWAKDKRLKQAGMFLSAGMVQGVSGLSQRVFTNALGWSIEEMELLLAEVRNEWKDRRVHSYCPMWVDICARF